MAELRSVASNCDPEARVLDTGPGAHESLFSLERQLAPTLGFFPKRTGKAKVGGEVHSTCQPKHLKERGYTVPKPQKSSIAILDFMGIRNSTC